MVTIEAEDFAYVCGIADQIGLDMPISITFWLDHERCLIGTSLAYDNKRRFWVQADPEQVRECKTRLELIEQIFPLTGQYLAYYRHKGVSTTQWPFAGSGSYDHSESVLRYNGKVLPERYRQQMMVHKGYASA